MDESEDESDRSLVPLWARKLKPVGKYYYSGVIENVESLLELHRRDTLCTFGTRTSVLKSRGDCENLNDSENNSQVKYNADIAATANR